MVRYKNYLAQMIITTRQCVSCKNRVGRSEVKVTDGELCLTPNFIKHGVIWKLFHTNDHHDKTMCHVQEPYR